MTKPYLFVFLLHMLLTFAAVGQTGCPVVADFDIITVEDTREPGKFNHTLINKSLNYSSFKVRDPLVHVLFHAENLIPQYRLEAGYYEYMMVATNGTCTDTMVKSIFVPGTIPIGKPFLAGNIGTRGQFHLPKSVSSTADDGFIVVSRNAQKNEQSLIARLTKDGCALWSKKTHYRDFFHQVSSTGNGYNYASFTTSHVNKGYVGLYKFLDDGTTVWMKNITVDGKSFYPLHSLVLTTGNIILIGRNEDDNILVVNMNRDGLIVWSKLLTFTSIDVLFHNYAYKPVQLGDNIYFPIFMVDFIPDLFPVYNTMSGLLSINHTSGNINWLKQYGSEDDRLSVFSVAKLGNKLVISGTEANKQTQNYLSTLGIIETDGTLVKMAEISDAHGVLTSSIYDLSGIDDQHFYMQRNTMNNSFPNNDLDYSIFAKLDEQFNIIWSKTHFNKGIPMGISTVERNGSIIGLGGEHSKAIDPLDFNFRLKFQRFEATTSPADIVCNFYNSSFTVDHKPPVITSSFEHLSFTDLQSAATDTTLELMDAFPEVRYKDQACQTYLDSCSLIKISGPQVLCNLKDTYTFNATLNGKCSQYVSWSIPENSTEINRTFNSITVKFNQLSEQIVYGYLKGTCIPLMDSIIVRPVHSLPDAVDLVNDTTLCEGQYLTLSVPADYKSLLWSTGNSDNSLKIDAPGKYWVRAEDHCSNVSSDTIVVDFIDHLHKDINPDTLVCSKSALSFDVPGQFTSSFWIDQNLSVQSSRSHLLISPTAPNKYIFNGVDVKGCMVTDTVAVTIFASPNLFIGNDTSVCKGEPVYFLSNVAFSAYQWNTGSTEPKITAKSAGKYILTGTTSEGCRVADTASIDNVFPLPTANMPKEMILCENETKLLLASGQHTSYLWSNGATLPTLEVNAIGEYWVRVWDINNCSSADTVRINEIKSPPSNFLADDMVVCQNQAVTISVPTTYQNVRWSNGQLGNSIEAKPDAKYYASVTDQFGCEGIDSIHIVSKQCLTGLFVPSAFSPNGDAQNDVFSAMLYGDVELFEMLIYNRFGKLVHQTTDSKRGWNGRVNGMIQNSGTYVWSIKYKLKGQSLQYQKGSFLLLH